MPKLMLFNANGLAGKADGVLRFVKEQAVDCCFIVETWLKETDSTGRLRPFLNLTRDSDQIIQRGGRRGQGGILGFCTVYWENDIRVLFSDPEKHFAFVSISDTIIGICYLPPSLDDRALDSFIDKATELSNDFAIETTLIGDFNARCGELTADSALNNRGKKLLERLENLPCNLIEPLSGRFTTFSSSGNGCGVTDHVISTVEVTDLVIHEYESLGGSDHRPLVFSLGTSEPKIAKDFTRWNVRKLANDDVKASYEQLLCETEEQVLAELKEIHRQLRSSPDIANEGWLSVKRWIENAALGSCGYFKYKTSVNKNFWTEELDELRAEISRFEFLRQVAVRNNDLVRAQHLARELTDLNQVFREAVTEQRYHLFTEVVNELGKPQNDGSFMKMAKCIKARRNNGGCKLDPTKVDEYAEHFKSTFGSEPIGNIELYNDVDRIDKQLKPVPLFNEEDIAKAISKLRFGKTPGVDGLPGEFFRFGGKAIIRVLTLLFNLILDTDIPEEWTQALIVPIFKKKGSDADIANYRPIALTCVCRRIFEKALMKHLDSVAEKLNDYQGGFRSKRSTLDSVFCLHEIAIEHSDLVSVFLDLQAAYDMVDRRILFLQLEKMNLDPEVIQVLKRLFDFNKSFLIVKGRKSQPIANLRGLLQGSSLSPLLFNLFINELVNELRKPEVPKVKTAGMKTNCLFFADDGNLHATNVTEMQKLLQICENWSRRVGMIFAPTKCVVIAKKRTRLSLYGNELPQPERATYLGIVFTWKGILWSEHLKGRANKAKGLINLFQSIGMNTTGWPQRSSALAYKSFIRATLEYGIALTVLQKSQIDKLQKVQNTALRSIFNSHRTGSIKALHRCLHVETMEHRNHQLNISFAMRLHNSKDSRRPPVNMWWNKVTELGTKSLAVTCKNENPLWSRAFKLNHVLERRSRNDSEPRAAFTSLVKKQIIKESIVGNVDNPSSVAGVIQVEPNDPIRHCMMPGVFKDKKTRVTVLRWIVGGVANHQVCKRCGSECSREHAADCSGANEFLKQFYEEHFDTSSEVIFLNQLLNKFRNEPPDDQFYERFAKAIGLIYSECLGYRQKRSGFWAADDEEQVREERNTRNRPVVRPIVESQAATERRRRIALQRNRPNGRPRSGVG